MIRKQRIVARVCVYCPDLGHKVARFSGVGNVLRVDRALVRIGRENNRSVFIVIQDKKEEEIVAEESAAVEDVEKTDDQSTAEPLIQSAGDEVTEKGSEEMPSEESADRKSVV